MIEAERILIQEHFTDIKLLMTTRLVEDPATPYMRARALVRRNDLTLDILSLPDLQTASTLLYTMPPQ